MVAIARRLLRGSSGSVIVIMLGSGAGQLLVLAASPILSRLYTPAQFGLFTALVLITSVTGTFALFRFDAAIPLPTSDRVAASVAWLALGLATVVSLVILAVGAWIGGPISRLVGTPGLGSVWWLVALATFMVAVDQVFLTWMVREKRYKALALRNALQGAGQAGGQVALGVSAALRPTGLLVGWIIGRVAAIGGLFSAGGLLRQGRPTVAGLTHAAKRYRRFPLVSSWSALINSLGQQVPLLVIGAYYGSITLGLVGFTVRIIAAPAALIGQAVGRVFQGEASAAIRDRRRTLRRIVVTNARTLFWLGLPICAVLAAFGPWLFTVVFGAEWAEAGTYARYLAVGYLAQLAVSPISQTLLILERQGYQLAWDVSRLIATVGGPVIAAAAGASATVAIMVLSAAFVVCYGVLYLACVRAARQYDGAPGGTRLAG